MSAHVRVSWGWLAKGLLSIACLGLAAGLLTASPAFADASGKKCGADYFDGLRAYDAGNKDAAVQIWTRSALEGDVRSQNRLGEIYERGDHVLINFVEAHKWYNLAANNDLQHCSGDFGSKEARQARDQARNSRDRLQDLMTNRAIADARNEIVDIYECRSNPHALFELGRMYQSGRGLPQSSIDACRYYAVAAAHGLREAKDALNVLNGVLKPAQIDNCQRQAAAWSRPSTTICAAAIGGSSLCKGGRQVPWANRQAALKALGFYHQGIDGAPGPATRAAIRRFQGSINANPTGHFTDPQICSLIERAASNGDGISEATLGEMYFSGIGKTKNYDSARDWLEQAADRGVPSALYRLGTMYVEGFGVTKDFYRGCRYLRQADSLGHPAADRALNKYCSN
jgi:TPR repeat protein